MFQNYANILKFRKLESRKTCGEIIFQHEAPIGLNHVKALFYEPAPALIRISGKCQVVGMACGNIGFVVIYNSVTENNKTVFMHFLNILVRNNFIIVGLKKNLCSDIANIFIKRIFRKVFVFSEHRYNGQDVYKRQLPRSALGSGKISILPSSVTIKSLSWRMPTSTVPISGPVSYTHLANGTSGG